MQTTQQNDSKIKTLAKITAAFFPRLNTEEEILALTLYRLLSQGEPVSTAMLARAIFLAQERVETYLQTWTGLDYDDEESVIGFWGLALTETDHYFEVAGKGLYTWCAWDTLFIPQLLGKTAQVQSCCAITGETVRLSVSPDTISELRPTESVLSFVTPEAAKVQENVVQHFCHYVHFFSSADLGRHWVSRHPGTFLLSISEAFYLGQLINQSRFHGTFQSK